MKSKEAYHFGRALYLQRWLMDRKSVGSLRTTQNDVLIQVIKEARLEAGVSQEELSKRMGQSITFIVKIERGTRRLDVIEFIRLANALNSDAEALFTKLSSQIRTLS